MPVLATHDAREGVQLQAWRTLACSASTTSTSSSAWESETRRAPGSSGALPARASRRRGHGERQQDQRHHERQEPQRRQHHHRVPTGAQLGGVVEQQPDHDRDPRSQPAANNSMFAFESASWKSFPNTNNVTPAPGSVRPTSSPVTGGDSARTTPEWTRVVAASDNNTAVAIRARPDRLGVPPNSIMVLSLPPSAVDVKSSTSQVGNPHLRAHFRGNFPKRPLHAAEAIQACTSGRGFPHAP